MPMNNDEYTSLVFRASAMATTGGRRDQMVPMKLKSIIFLPLYFFGELFVACHPFVCIFTDYWVLCNTLI